MMDPSEPRIEPKIRLRDGRNIGSIGEAIAVVREHQSRPGVDARDEVLHHLERAQNDQERQAAAKGFIAWATELGLVSQARPLRRG